MSAKLILTSIAGDEFERTLNQVFEDILITGWRGPARVRNFGQALITEHEDQYRVKIAAAGVNPHQIEVEVSEWRLTVRLPITEGSRDSIFDFSHRVDIDRVTARCEGGMLDIILPKTSGRRVEVH